MAGSDRLFSGYLIQLICIKMPIFNGGKNIPVIGNDPVVLVARKTHDVHSRSNRPEIIKINFCKPIQIFKA